MPQLKLVSEVWMPRFTGWPFLSGATAGLPGDTRLVYTVIVRKNITFSADKSAASLPKRRLGLRTLRCMNSFATG